MENKLIKVKQNSIMKNFVKTDDILKDMCGISECYFISVIVNLLLMVGAGILIYFVGLLLIEFLQDRWL